MIYTITRATNFGQIISIYTKSHIFFPKCFAQNIDLFVVNFIALVAIGVPGEASQDAPEVGLKSHLVSLLMRKRGEKRWKVGIKRKDMV